MFIQFTLGFLSELCTISPHTSPSPRVHLQFIAQGIDGRCHGTMLGAGWRWLKHMEVSEVMGGFPNFHPVVMDDHDLGLKRSLGDPPWKKNPPNCGTTNYYETQKSGSSYHFWSISGYVHLKIIDTRVCLKLQHVKWAVKYILMVKWKWMMMMMMMMMMNYGIFGMGMGQTPIMFDKASFDIQKD